MKTKQLLVVLGLCLFWSILSLCTVILLGCGNAEDATVTGGEDTTIADGDDANIIGKIAFHSNRDGDSDIYVMDADSGNVVNLTNNEGVGDYHPAWSPDGTKIAFHSPRELGSRDINVY